MQDEGDEKKEALIAEIEGRLGWRIKGENLLVMPWCRREMKKIFLTFLSIMVFVISGCVPFPSRYKLWETYVRSYPKFRPSDRKGEKKEAKSVYVGEYYGYGDLDRDIVPSLINQGFAIVGEADADLILRFGKMIRNEQPDLLPGPLLILSNNDYRGIAFEVTFIDTLNMAEVTKTYEALCRTTLWTEINPYSLGGCDIYYGIARRISEDLRKFADNKAF